MKYYIFLLGLFLLGCKNQASKQDTITSAQDTIEQLKITGDYELLFQELSSQTYIQARDFAKLYPDEYKISNAVYGLILLTDNSDTLNVILDFWLDKYYERKGIIKETNTVKEYEQRSNIINKLIIDIDQMDESQDIVGYVQTTSIYKKYLCDYYSDKLLQLPKDYRLQNVIEKEIDAWNRFYDSQAESLRVFISDIGSGSTRGFTFLHFRTSFYSRMQQSILDLYWALTNDNYEIAKKFIPIGQMHFEKEYQLSSNLMQDSTMFSNDYYSFDQRINIVKQEKEAWYELMGSRNKVSQHLTGSIKSVYDNATYRLQKQHLVELKNEFGEYGISSSEYQELLLTDDCDYKELLNSKRTREAFNTKWYNDN